MPSVAPWYVDAYKIPYGVQKVRNNSESVLVEGFYALIFVGDVLVVRRTDEGPVSAALVQDDAEELVDVRVLEAGIHKQDVVLNSLVYVAHDSCLAVKGYQYKQRLIGGHCFVYFLGGGVFYEVHIILSFSVQIYKVYFIY